MISALAFVIICMTLIAAVLLRVLRRHRKKRLESAAKMYKEISSDRLKEDSKKRLLFQNQFLLFYLYF